jgi:XTP/dITP diphosphohydrolase
LETLGPSRTAKLITGKNRKAKVTDAIAYFDGKSLKVFKGTVKGTITKVAKGEPGFGFDVVFMPKGSSKTFAEMSEEEKNKISHRALALKKVKKYLYTKNSDK